MDTAPAIIPRYHPVGESSEANNKLILATLIGCDTVKQGKLIMLSGQVQPQFNPLFNYLIQYKEICSTLCPKITQARFGSDLYTGHPIK